MYFDTVYATFEEMNYKPRYHFGKIINITSGQMRTIYPKMDDFLKIRSEIDPKRLFVNDMLAEILGLQRTEL